METQRGRKRTKENCTMKTKEREFPEGSGQLDLMIWRSQAGQELNLPTALGDTHRAQVTQQSGEMKAQQF